MPGLSSVIRIPGQVDKTPNQVLDEMKKKLEILGGTRICSTRLESSVYLSLNKRASACHSFQVMTYSEYPATCFVFSDADIALTCDLSFREFPGLLKGVFEHERKQQVDGVGVKFRLGDFFINFISLCLGQSATIKGLLLEVSFAPAFHPFPCIDLLRSFIRQYFPEVCPCDMAIDNIFTTTFKSAIQQDSVSGTTPAAVQLLQSARPEQLITGEMVKGILSRSAALLSASQFVEHFNVFRSPA